MRDDPVFPSFQAFEKYDERIGRCVQNYLPTDGLSKRELFAIVFAHAAEVSLSNYLSREEILALGDDRIRELVAEGAVKDADALLKELAKGAE
jgi:hypothetical protein